jgi:putative membrane-bound dehydrogenase-like protein
MAQPVSDEAGTELVIIANRARIPAIFRMPDYQCFRALLWSALSISVFVAAENRVCAASYSTNALSPEKELASFQLADPKLIVELVAAEPDVISPVAIAFDPDGKLFVAEMIDYPTGPGSGRIRLLQDRDGDGKYETVTAFAENLPFPNSVLPWKGGVLITAAPDLWFLKDEDGDGRADTKRVLFTGFGRGNQQLRANGLTWGLDNWVYGANGRSDGEVSGGALTNRVSLRGHDFRFRPDTGEFEALAGRCQFGLGYDDWGNRFLSWNTIPIRHEVLPERYLNRNPALASTESLQDIIEPGDNGEVFPLAPPPLTFNNESIRSFNALAGLKIFRGTALGEAYRGNAFMGEALLSLVHRRILEPDGVTFVARRGERRTEFLASSDPWFHGVNYATGPDGALYVVDFYRRFVEHPDFVQGKPRNETPWRTGAEHGRIWRIRNREVPIQRARPQLSKESSSELVDQLRNPNGWWRDAAQRVVIERNDSAAAPALRKMATSDSYPLARLHAAYTLNALGSLNSETVVKLLSDSDPHLREHAIRLAEQQQELQQLEPVLRKFSDDENARVRFQLALAAGSFSESGRVDLLATLARRDVGDRWQRLAILSSVGPTGWKLLSKLCDDGQWLQSLDAPADFLEQLARLIAASGGRADIQQCLALASEEKGGSLAPGRLAMLNGLAEGLPSSMSLRKLVGSEQTDWQLNREAIRKAIELGVALAFSNDASVPARIRALRLLSRDGFAASSGAEIVRLLVPTEPIAVQAAAARALGEVNDPAVAESVFNKWTTYSAATRRNVIESTPRSSALTSALLARLEAGTLSMGEVPPNVRQALLRRNETKSRFEKVFKADGSDRGEVIAKYQPVVSVDGDPKRGAAVFAKNCIVCHSTKGVGGHVGPDLSGIGSKPNSALLVDILDPSRQVSPDYANYSVETADGKAINGFIVAENATSVTFRRPNEPDETLLRSQIKSLRAETKSLMPEGLEQGMTEQGLADLLAFLRYPDAKYLVEANDVK